MITAKKREVALSREAFTRSSSPEAARSDLRRLSCDGLIAQPQDGFGIPDETTACSVSSPESAEMGFGYPEYPSQLASPTNSR